MNEPWATILLVVLAVWQLVVFAGVVAILVSGRPKLAAFIDLIGVWAGAISGVALALGRAGFQQAWAVALLCVAVAVTATLYDRAVLLPSIEAAGLRSRHDRKWQRDERYLWGLSHGSRAVSLLLVFVALWSGFVLWIGLHSR